ncbi:methyl-accepting chemotaxis protein [Shewanella profunda]|uniref:methyl-accepting chemotaxis protein n=1 Tax=Shewanella profunda TaxID=254793 RepID=UPI00200D59AE|nr:methyl-accepting chemotaxis protein [Shewanella profunda]MCL1088574.1 methyl-accepting chemotaxis protein [Shewanella profunda]
MEGFRRLLGNISVTNKLRLGFGILLLLIFIVAAAGYKGLTSIDISSSRLEFIANVDKALLAAKTARLEFIASGDLKKLDQLQILIEDTKSGLQGQLSESSDIKDREYLQQSMVAMDRYHQSINQFSDVFKHKQELKVTGAQVGAKLVATYAELVDRMTNTAQATQNTELLKDALSVSQQMTMLRYYIRGYVYDSSDINLKTAKDAITKLLQTITTLKGEDTAQAIQILNRYDHDIDALVDVNRDLENLALSMGEAAQTLIVNIRELVDIQKHKRDEADAQAKSVVIVTLIVALVVGPLLAWLISGQIVGPLKQTLITARKIAAGDLSSTIHSERKDEMGELLRTMGEMNSTLKEVLTQIGDSVVKLASSAEVLSAVTEQNSAGMQNQRSETDQVATAINEMAATVQEVSASAENVALAAKEADHTTATGNKKVIEAVGQIELLAKEIATTANAMERLQSESDSIGTVLDVIKSVAEQTNLLALNAAIEAARAGEAGRGFAVVADEVRSLASRTQSSTKEIENMIVNLQKGTLESVQMMTKSRTLSDGAVSLSREAEEMLVDIADAVNRIQDMTHQIAAASEEQSAVAEDINKSIVKVRDIAEQTADGAAETARSAEDLASLGITLKGLLRRFKL